MGDESIRARISALAASLPDVRVRPCWGEETYFHRPPGSRKRDGRAFLCIRAAEAGERFSLPLPRETFVAWFGEPPPRPRRRQSIPPERRRGPFAPHPHYAWAAWVAAEGVTEADVEALGWAVREAYTRVVEEGAP